MSKRPATAEEKMTLRVIFGELPDKPCADCGGFHWRACPRVRRQAWSANGTVRTEVEYWARWDDSEVFWPEEIWDEEDEDGRGDDAAGPVHPR
jgi:hypothetical protein